MATTRKRSTSGFAVKEEFIEEAVNEPQTESVAEETPSVVFDEEENETDPEPTLAPATPVVVPKSPVATVKPVVLNPPPKRHPRNIPKFSSHK